MLEKLLAHCGANAAGVESQPRLVMLLKLIHSARQDAPFEAIHRAVLPVNLIHALMADGGLEFRERHSSTAQRMGERLR